MSDPSAPAPSNLPESEGPGSVTVVGTAHVSQESVDEVERTVTERQPDVVAVELDEGRYGQLKGETPDDLDAGDLLKGNTVFQFLAYWMLSYVQTRLGEQFDVSPGAEMLAAVETAEAHGLGVALVDRDIQTTMQRFWARMTFKEKLVMLASLAAELDDPWVVATGLATGVGVLFGLPIEIIAGPLILPQGQWFGSLGAVGGLGGIAIAVLDGLLVVATVAVLVGVPLGLVLGRFAPAEDEDIESFDVADLTDTDVVSAMMEEFRRFSPGGAEALIDERDAFIAHRLVALRDAGYDVVAVVGAGHKEGIERYLENPEELPPMESLVGQESGGRFSPYKLFGYVFTLGFVVLFGLIAMAGVSNTFLLKLFGAWFLVNGVFAAVLARIAGAHWTSSLVGGGIAWLTSINPLLAPGWFAGYVELRYLSVKVTDIERLNEILADETAPLLDIVKRMRAVPLFRLILIVALTNIGSMVASGLFVTWILPLFGAGADCTINTPLTTLENVPCLLYRGARNSASTVVGFLS